MCLVIHRNVALPRDHRPRVHQHILPPPQLRTPLSDLSLGVGRHVRNWISMRSYRSVKSPCHEALDHDRLHAFSSVRDELRESHTTSINSRTLPDTAGPPTNGTIPRPQPLHDHDVRGGCRWDPSPHIPAPSCPGKACDQRWERRLAEADLSVRGTREGWECRGKGQANQRPPPQPDSDQPAHGSAGCLRRRRRRLLLLDLYRARHTKPDALAHDYDDGALQVAQHGRGLCVGEARLSVD